MPLAKKYVEFKVNHPKGYLAGKNVFYECLICNAVVESQPQYFDECQCQNITVDTSGGRLSITDHTQFKMFKQ